MIVMVRTLVLAAAVAICPATAGAQSFWSIFTELPSDFGHLTEPSNLAILGSAGAGSLAIHQKDEQIAENAAPNTVFTAGDVLGEGWVHAVAGFGIYSAGRLSHRENFGRLGVDLVQGQIVGGIITEGSSSRRIERGPTAVAIHSRPATPRPRSRLPRCCKATSAGRSEFLRT